MTTEGQPVGAEKQISEAFSLGTTLATIGADVRHLVGGVDELKGTLGTAVTDIGRLTTNDARQDEQLKTLFAWKRDIESTPEPDYVTRDDFDQLRNDIQSSRLTWPKLFTGIAALAGAAAVLLAFAESLGAFGR